MRKRGENMELSDSLIIDVPFQEVNQSIQASDRAMNNLNNSAQRYVEIMSEADKVSEGMNGLSGDISRARKSQDDLINSGGNLKGISTELAVCTDETRELALAQTQAVDRMRELGDIKGIEPITLQMTNLIAIQNNAITMQEEMNKKTEKSAGLFERLGKKAKEAISKNMVPFIKDSLREAMNVDKEMRNMQNAFGNKEVGAAYYKSIDKTANESAFNKDELMNNTTNFMGMTKNTNQLDRISNLSQRLSLKNPNEGLESSGNAIKQAMQGDGKQLKDSFGFKGADIDILSASSSMDEFIGKFDQLLNNKGATQGMLEDLNNSPTAQFENIKSNFTTALGEMGGGALQALTPLMGMLNEAFSSGKFQPFFDGIAMGLYIVANAVVWLVDGFKWIGDTFSEVIPYMIPVILGIAAAIGIWMLSLKLAEVSQSVFNFAQEIYSLITGKATIAQLKLNGTLYACPITWMVLAIVAVIAAIIAWAAHTYGLQATWLMVTNVLMTSWAELKIAAFMMAFGIMNIWDNLGIAAHTLSVGIQNKLGDMKAGGLMILQGFVNGAIDMINDLIRHVNRITGTSIEVISHVTFGTKAKMENDIEKAARNKDLANYVAEKEADKQKRQDTLNNMINKANADLADREAKIEAAKKAHADGSNKSVLDNMFNKWNKNQGPGDWDNLMNGTKVPGAPAGMPAQSGMDNLSKSAQGSQNHLNNIDNNVEASTEHLDVLRDLAEIESIQNFVTLTPTVQVTTGDIKEEADINNIITKIENYMQTQLVTSAEGVYA